MTRSAPRVMRSAAAVRKEEEGKCAKVGRRLVVVAVAVEADFDSDSELALFASGRARKEKAKWK